MYYEWILDWGAAPLHVMIWTWEQIISSVTSNLPPELVHAHAHRSKRPAMSCMPGTVRSSFSRTRSTSRKQNWRSYVQSRKSGWICFILFCFCKVCIINPFTAMLAALSLGKQSTKVPNLKSLRSFSPLLEYVKRFLSKCTVLKVDLL